MKNTQDDGFYRCDGRITFPSTGDQDQSISNSDNKVNEAQENGSKGVPKAAKHREETKHNARIYRPQKTEFKRKYEEKEKDGEWYYKGRKIRIKLHKSNQSETPI